jgi:pyridinium-3,5-biscarboxylic acid mononucleotide sulfurtransferase
MLPRLERGEGGAAAGGAGQAGAERDPAAEPEEPDARLAGVVADLAARGSVLVAYSGGVDSALVAALAVRAVGSRALALTAAAETLAGAELDHARRLAGEIGIRHEVVTYSELDEPEFVANPAHRCYVCQGLRMDVMRREAARRGLAVVCDGTNASDPGPDRPGLRAVRERGVYSPLLVHGIDKAAARAMARSLGLSAWDRPANACLSSRIPHGQVVTLGKLRRIEAAEELLAARGFRVVRVRDDQGRARVEVGAGEVERLAAIWGGLAPGLRTLGFASAAFDPRGYRRGGADHPAPAAAGIPTAASAASAAGVPARRLRP